MKQNRFLSLLLALTLALGLLIPVSHAAVTTGTGLTISQDPNHSITRVNTEGKAYVYRPPFVDGVRTYCVDWGYSFNSTSASFLDSYTWERGTGADADAIWERAMTISGMDNFSPEVEENAKWLMSYVYANYTLDDPQLGASSMAVQTYLWDNMVWKEYGDVADEGSNIDDSTYADPATYAQYQELYNSMLEIKAQEDAELERQLEEELAKGVNAYIAADPSTQFAIYATSGVSGRQGFLVYHEQRKLYTGELPDDIPEEPDDPGDLGDPSGGSLTIRKLCGKTDRLLPGATFRVEGIDVAYETTVTTGADGAAVVEGEVPVGSYRITELDPPEGFLPSGQVETIHYDGENPITVSFVNHPLAQLTIQKQDADTGAPVSAVFDVYRDTQRIDTIRVDGTEILTGLTEGTYTFVEVSCPGNYILDPTPHSIYVAPDDKATVNYDPIVTNQRKPGLEILKYDLVTKKPLAGVTFAVYHDTVLYGEFTTDETGRIYLNDVDPGTWMAVEVATDDDHILNSTPQQIELKPGDTVKTLVFFNQMKPGIWLVKVDSADLSKPIPNVKFEIRAVDGSFGPEEFTTDQNGEIDLSRLDPGAYVVTELECPGYVIDEAQRIIQLDGDETAAFVFTNSKRPGIRLLKLDSYDSAPLGGVTFRIAKIEDGSHYLDRVTDHNGEIYVGDLDPGVYSVTEIDVPEGYIKNEQEWHVALFPGRDSTLVVTNDRKSDLTIIKTDADTGEPVPGVTFILNKVDGPTITTEATGEDGSVTIPRLEPGVYTVTEQSVPEGYILDTTPQMVTLFPNRNATVQFQNYKRPTLTIHKVDINGNLLPGAIFEVRTKSGVKIGDFPVDENGTVTISNAHLDEGYYIITVRP